MMKLTLVPKCNGLTLENHGSCAAEFSEIEVVEILKDAEI
jgi:hypothetical protein